MPDVATRAAEATLQLLLSQPPPFASTTIRSRSMPAVVPVSVAVTVPELTAVYE